jgi:hypothetical protein
MRDDRHERDDDRHRRNLEHRFTSPITSAAQQRVAECFARRPIPQ